MRVALKFARGVLPLAEVLELAAASIHPTLKRSAREALAREALEDARVMLELGDLMGARRRALESLRLSVGEWSTAYQRANPTLPPFVRPLSRSKLAYGA